MLVEGAPPARRDHDSSPVQASMLTQPDLGSVPASLSCCRHTSAFRASIEEPMLTSGASSHCLMVIPTFGAAGSGDAGWWIWEKTGLWSSSARRRGTALARASGRQGRCSLITSLAGTLPKTHKHLSSLADVEGLGLISYSVICFHRAPRGMLPRWICWVGAALLGSWQCG